MHLWQDQTSTDRLDRQADDECAAIFARLDALQLALTACGWLLSAVALVALYLITRL